MIEQIQPAELSSRFKAASEHGAPLLLDVREPAEWQAASARPADVELLQMSMQTIPARLSELDPERPIAVLCHHGARSMQVAMFLAHHGFTHLANVTGGIDAWSVQLDPTVPRY